MGARTFLVHGLLAGLLAGIAAFVVAYTVGEPQVDKAIALEEAASAPASDGHDHTHDDNEEGRRRRAQKDEPGRHDDAYYGGKGKPLGVRAVSSGQGARPFGTRKRPV